MSPPRLRDELRDDWRTVFAVPLGSLCLIGWGLQAANDDEARQAHQLLGSAAVIAGVLCGASYIAHFRPGVLAEDDWQETPWRRRLAWAARHLWAVMLGAALVVAMVDDIRA